MGVNRATVSKAAGRIFSADAIDEARAIIRKTEPTHIDWLAEQYADARISSGEGPAYTVLQLSEAVALHLYETAEPAYTVAHIIDNTEIAITECGKMLAELPERQDNSLWTEGPFKVADREVALWDYQPTPREHVTCQACFEAYNTPSDIARKVY